MLRVNSIHGKGTQVQLEAGNTGNHAARESVTFGPQFRNANTWFA